MGFLDKIVKVILEIIENLPKILASLEVFTNYSLLVFETAITKYNALKSKTRDSEINATDLRYSLRRASTAAHAYVDTVDDVFWYCNLDNDEKRAKRVKMGIETGDFSELMEYLDVLKSYLDKCAEAHEEAEKALKDIQSNSIRVAGECSKKAQEEKTKKNVTRGVGGTAAAGAVVAGTAGGVAASVVAGVFTLGIGTVVGLALTAAGSVAAGAGVAAATGVATHLIAEDFKEAEKNFKSLNGSFNDLHSKASSMLETICQVRACLETVVTSRHDLERTVQTHRSRSSVTTALENLCHSLGESYESSSTYLGRMKTKDEKVQNI